MRQPNKTRKMQKSPRRGSILFTTTILLMVAGASSLTWSAYIGSAHRAAQRDRDQLLAFYAAEAGVEQVVDYFNNQFNYVGATPASYTADMASHPPAYAGTASFAPDEYQLFEPYIVNLLTDESGDAVYSPEGNLIITTTSYFRDPGAGSNAAISRTSKIPTFEVDLSNNDMVRFLVGDSELCEVERIEVFNPADIADLDRLATNTLIVAEVRATGLTPRGIRASVRSIITENPAFDIRSPGAIISRASAAFNGNFNVHWGELWTRSDMQLPNNYLNMVPRYDPNVDYSNANPTSKKDRWFRIRTEGWIKSSNGNNFANGSDRNGFTSTAPASSTPQYTQPFTPTGMHPQLRNHDGLENMYQNQTLEFPNYDYDEWKDFVRSHGFGYYYTNGNGTIFGVEKDESSANYGRVVGKTYNQWFDSDPSAANYWELRDLIVFIDSVPVDNNGNPGPTVDGVPVINNTYYPRNPNVDGVMGNIQVAGQGAHTRGAMFIAANMTMQGQGNPPNWDAVPESAGGGVRMPNGNVPPETIRMAHNGLMYSWGWMSFAGNRSVFGSIFAERGYQGNGTPSVYYNYRLGDGSWLNLNISRVRRTMWDVTAPPVVAMAEE